MLLNFSRHAARSQRKALDESRDTSADVTEEEFIPCAFHYDSHTLMTKNGELMQILRITANQDGIDYESPEPGVLSLRDALRRVINETVPSNRYGFWFHTLRRRQPIRYAPVFHEPFASELHQAWQRSRRWQHSYTNEVYISVLRQGKTAEMFDMKQISACIVPSRNRRHHEAYTDTCKEELDLFVRRLLEALKAHSSVERLAIVKRPAGGGHTAMYSEPLEFLHYLVNLQSRPMPVADMNTARQLNTHDITFGFDAMETRGKKGHRHFAAILTIKGLPELSPQVLDKCLQLPEELIISQSFNYIPGKQALEERLKLKDAIVANTVSDIAHLTALDAYIDSDRGQETDFGEQQTSITVIRDKYRQLDQAIGNVQENLSKLGLISVREDIMLEDCFWGQLPGNFTFLRRRSPVNAARMASLARLNHFPSGNSAGNPWGFPVTILPTSLGTPYFLNFHHGRCGHTLVLDFNSFADARGTSLINFLLACTRQYNGRLFIFDRNRTARPLVQALNGNYCLPLGRAQTGDLPITLNPLQLDDTPRNRAFLSAWLSYFVREETTNDPSTRLLLQEVIEKTFTAPPDQRTVEYALRLIVEQDPSLPSPDHAGLASAFRFPQDTLDLAASICAIDMQDIMEQPRLATPAFSYLLHRVIQSLDGTPTVIVMHEAWDLLDNDFFLPRIGSLLDMLTQSNAIVIFTTRHFESHADSYLTRELWQHTPTKMFLPDDVITDYFPEITELTEREVRVLSRMERQKGQFLLKHGREVVECAFPSDGLEAFHNTLAGDVKALRLMQIQQR